MKISKYIGLTGEYEKLLAEALLLIADRHGENSELAQTGRLLAEWSLRRERELEPVAQRLGRARVNEDPGRLRSALFHDPRLGGLGQLRDLHDVALLAHQVKLCWTVMGQAAQALEDHALYELCNRSGLEAQRQIQWLETHVKVTAPQALAVAPQLRHQLSHSLPRRWSGAAAPDGLWSPIAASVAIGFVGLVAWVAGQPWIAPSLGPSAYLLATEASHPSARAYSTITGHTVALGAGFAAVAIFGAWAEPALLAQGLLAPARVGAAALAVFLCVAVLLPMRATHPPAAATTLLVALGSLSTWRDAVGVIIGAALLSAVGVPLRRIRMGRIARRRELSPAATSPRPVRAAAGAE